MLILAAILTCLTASAHAAGDGYESWKKNPDQTITLTNPYHSPENRSYTVGISKKSDLDGVCRHYGLNTSVFALFVPSDQDYLAIIDSSGDVAAYYGHDDPQLNQRILSIACTQIAKKAHKKRSKKSR